MRMLLANSSVSETSYLGTARASSAFTAASRAGSSGRCSVTSKRVTVPSRPRSVCRPGRGTSAMFWLSALENVAIPTTE